MYQGRPPTRSASKRFVGEDALAKDKALLARGRHPPHQGRSTVCAKVGKPTEGSNQGVKTSSGLVIQELSAPPH